ncbi:MFS transporter [Kribbella pittospori]|uniref:MFS transporter n=1 Tax=Kribbella pittospori TaxID=722689 RepID=A0A4R0JV26_9ACTN|nr:MFS transporter [Kribbella pittospori]
MSWRADFAVLRHREVRLFLSARFVSLLGSAVGPIALAFAVLDLSDSARTLGLVLASQSVPMVGLMLLGGAIADRLPRRLVLVVAHLVCGTTQATAAVLLLSGQAEIWHLIVLGATNGVATAVSLPALSGILPELVDAAELPQANAASGIARSTGTLLGGAVAGVIVGFIGPAPGLAVDAAAFLLAASLLSRLPLTRLARTSKSLLKDLVEGWSDFIRTRWVVVISLVMFANQFVWVGCWVTLGPVIADESLGRAGWAISNVFLGLGFLTGGFLVLRVKPSHPLRFGILGILLMIPALLCLALAPRLPLVALCALGVGIGFQAISVGVDTALGQHIPLGKLSRISSYVMLATYAAMPLAQLTVGLIDTSPRTVELAAAAAFTTTLLLALCVPSIRNLPRLT